MMNNPLLQRYVAARSEPAFAELVQQHIDLVYSAALRQLNGDATTAQDVTQAVFTALARNAPRLLRHVSLTGWLYTSTRYLSAKARRSEQRRAAREQEACTMNQLLQSTGSDPAWQELRPVLDEAMHDLSADDREAVLLRFFEQRSLAEIGTRLGLTEDTARKRVARALDKLRAGLARRGITSTVAALSVALAERTVSAAPAGMAGQVSRAAVAEAAAGGGSIALLWKLLAGAGAVATAAGLLVLPGMLHQNRQAASSMPGVAAAQPAATAAAASSMPLVAAVQPAAIAAAASVPSSTPASAPVLTAAQSSDTTNKLVLHIVTADSGKPVPSVTLDYRLFIGNNVKHLKPLTASVLGICEVPVPRATVTQLTLVSQRDGFADTRLQWHVDRGEIIPQEYTLRLARAVTIGGTVVDADGNPVPDAQVSFYNQVDPAADLAIESSDFTVPYDIEAVTDSRGHWQTSRLTRDTLRTLSGAASHPLHLPVGFSGRDAEIQKQLLAGTYEFKFKMGRPVPARGTVADNDGNPIPNAKVTVWSPGRPPRETNSGVKGRFLVAGCAPGKAFLSAEAEGFAPTTLSVDLSANTGPFQLILQPGELLRLRVVDTKGLPVTNADVWLDTMPGEPLVVVGTEFHARTDSGGLVEWSSAPDGELAFDFAATGYLRLNHQMISADGQEHTVTLSPALTIAGTVRDSVTGAPIPRFSLAAGFPETNPTTGLVIGHWMPVDRFLMSFTGGKFHHSFEEPIVVNIPNPGFIFKFEADGYAPFVSRPVALEEGEVQLDVAMQPARTTTVTVTLPDGRPAAGVDVGIVSPASGRLLLVPGGFSRLDQLNGGSILLTDSQGRFTLKPDDSVTGVVAAGAAGYAGATPAALADQPVMALQPWGRLEGTLLAQGRPGTNRALSFQLGTDYSGGIWTEPTAYQTKTDAEGHFVFAQVPPGKHQLMQAFEAGLPNSPAVKLVGNRPLTNVDIRPGEITTVTVDGTGPGIPVP
jgi:RNA polymerase sigma factor (sigma-70 family)